jgi:hypothetical protein
MTSNIRYLKLKLVSEGIDVLTKYYIKENGFVKVRSYFQQKIRTSFADLNNINTLNYG